MSAGRSGSSPAPRGRSLPRPERRARLLLAMVLAVLLLFVGRLVQVQAVDADALAEAGLESRLGPTQILPAPRGDIVDASGEVLATSVERRDVVVDPTLVDLYERHEGEGDDRHVVSSGLQGAAADLAPLLGRSVKDVRQALTGDSPEDRYNVVARGIEPVVWRKASELGIPGLTSVKTYARSYPAGSVAGNVLGFTGGDDDSGLAGVELTEDAALTGTDGSQTVERGAGGQEIPMGENHTVEPVPGSTVELTIDRDLQWYAQNRAQQMREQTKAEWISVVALDVHTGEVLALAEAPSVDPNDPGATPAESRGSRAVSDVFEPGSTSKVVTASALVEEGLVDPLDEFEVPYEFEIDGQRFKDSHAHELEKLTFAGIIGESSNTGTVAVGSRLSKQQRYEYMTRFGFGSPTGIGLPGETAGILGTPETWDGRQEYTVLFGQGVSVNTLQAAGVYATIANGGVRIPPRVVRGTVDAEGEEHPAAAATPVRVVSEDTAQKVSRMLEGVVSEGTGTSAQIPGYRVAGKTGTAEAPDANGGYSGYTSSFIGYAPAGDPEVVVAVTVQRPEVGRYGGEVAAPVFKDVMSFALGEREAPPSGEAADLYPQTW